MPLSNVKRPEKEHVAVVEGIETWNRMDFVHLSYVNVYKNRIFFFFFQDGDSGHLL